MFYSNQKYFTKTSHSVLIFSDIFASSKSKIIMLPDIITDFFDLYFWLRLPFFFVFVSYFVLTTLLAYGHYAFISKRPLESWVKLLYLTDFSEFSYSAVCSLSGFSHFMLLCVCLFFLVLS